MAIRVLITGATSLKKNDVLELQLLSGKNLAQNIYLSGFVPPPALCSGLKRCGLCKVKFISEPPAVLKEEETLFSAEEIAAGWRLACRQIAKEGMCVELPSSARLIKSTGSGNSDKKSGKAFLAVDLGTTTIHWQVVMPSGEFEYKVLRQGAEINPQMGAGSDVISRLHEARDEKGTQVLSLLVQKALARITDSLPYNIEGACLAGNTAMTSIFFGLNTAGLAHAPYSLPLKGDEEYSLPSLPKFYVPRQLSPFIGGDVVAGMTAILANTYGKVEYPFLLADLGTNAELVLAVAENTFLTTSVPMGPALEGMGLSCGILAGVGGDENAATSFRLTPSGVQAENIAPELTSEITGISGTGYLSLLAILLKNKIIGENGNFITSSSQNVPIAEKIRQNLKKINHSVAFALTKNIYLSAQDVEEILKVKAAFSLALKKLLSAAELSTASLCNIYLAGALGKYVNVEDLKVLGFLPAQPLINVNSIGNSSLAGASVLACHKKAGKLAASFASVAKVVSFTNEADFLNSYAAEMKFAW